MRQRVTDYRRDLRSSRNSCSCSPGLTDAPVGKSGWGPFRDLVMVMGACPDRTIRRRQSSPPSPPNPVLTCRSLAPCHSLPDSICPKNSDPFDLPQIRAHRCDLQNSNLQPMAAGSSLKHRFRDPHGKPCITCAPAQAPLTLGRTGRAISPMAGLELDIAVTCTGP